MTACTSYGTDTRTQYTRSLHRDAATFQMDLVDGYGAGVGPCFRFLPNIQTRSQRRVFFCALREVRIWDIIGTILTYQQAFFAEFPAVR